MEQKKDLLDSLAEAVGCACLSDLHGGGYDTLICRTIERLNARDFSVRDWKSAILYLTGESRECKDAEAAKEFLLQALTRSGN